MNSASLVLLAAVILLGSCVRLTRPPGGAPMYPASLVRLAAVILVGSRARLAGQVVPR